jgi:hypothetical protein
MTREDTVTSASELIMNDLAIGAVLDDHATGEHSLRDLSGCAVRTGWAVNGFTEPLRLKRRHINTTDMRSFIAKHRAVLNTRAFVVGTWYDGEWTIIDILRVFTDRSIAEANARFNRKDVMYDVAKAKEISIAA